MKKLQHADPTLEHLPGRYRKTGVFNFKICRHVSVA